MSVYIEALQPQHFPRVSSIFGQGISTGNATFETSAPSWEQWNESHLLHSRLVAIDQEEVVGWAALSPVSKRQVYIGVAEVSVYVSLTHSGRGIGRTLLRSLISESENNGIWTLNAGIFPENTVSIHLHESLGFRRIGYRERIGKLNGIWRDTLQFERRSSISGI
jgi:L-amino acid N-acyltransferase YncA